VVAEDEASSQDDGTPSTPQRAIAARGWRGDEHKLHLEAAGEVGLEPTDVEVDLYTQGFRDGITLEDPDDRAIVLRGRTVLRGRELHQNLKPLLRYVGVSYDAVKVRVHEGQFEIRVARRAAEASRAALDNAMITLKLWFGFGLLGLSVLLWSPFLAQPGAAVLWGIGLMLGGWQLRKGIAGGRSMLAARLAIGLALMAQEEQLILPLAGDGGPSPSGT
jgi:hypothetical protein